MIIRSISIRSKLHIATLVIVIILAVLSLIYMDASRRNAGEADLLKKRSLVQWEYHSLAATFQKMVLDEEINLIATCIGQIRRIEEQLETILIHDAVLNSVSLERKSDLIFSTLDRLAENLRIKSGTDSLAWRQARTNMVILG